MSHFRQNATTAECFSQLISNQLQMLNLLEIHRSDMATSDSPKQIAKLRAEIIKQRDELKILVDGV